MTEVKSEINQIANFNPKKYMIGGQFDLASFNADFLKVIDKQEIEAKKIENKKLREINDYYYNEKKYGYHQKDDLSDLTISNILNKWFDAIVGILTDILRFSGSFDDFKYIFTKENRKFYIGLTILFVVSLLYFINNYILNDKNNISIGSVAKKFVDFD